ncbi:zinc-binding dehydrogenase [Microbacterium sp. YY-01]|uniref:zinc-binding dehydrogenase n=1 Tax=Microbacterium sp. YY-01 TaxID=3421634 RepID=UPI003D1813FF
MTTASPSHSPVTSHSPVRAIVAHGAGDLRVDQHPLPQPGPGEVRVRIAFGGICGSDLHYAATGRNGIYEIREPLTLGHEVVGTVDGYGPGASGTYPPGTPVAIHPATPTPAPGASRGSGLNLAVGGSYLGSASTTPHTHGGFTDALIVTEAQLRPLPTGLDLRRAVLTEPLAVAIHAVGLIEEQVGGSRVLVSGCGPIGALAVAALRHAGAAHITACDLHRMPLDIATRVGANQTIQLGTDPAPESDSYDIVVEAAGVVPSLTTALNSVRRGGTIVQLGMLPPGELAVALAAVVSKEVRLQGTQRFDSEFDEALAMLAVDPTIEEVISHEFDADDAAEAFRAAADSARSGKVIVRMNA